jgi:hypothetical protein
MGEVVYVKPKERTFKYRRYDISIRFLPDERQWLWEFSYTITRRLHGYAPTFSLAEEEAKKWVDEIEQREV